MMTPPSVRSRFTSIEALENRIAPAGLVTVDYNPATGVLTLDGDTADNVLSIFPTGRGTHRIEGNFTDLSTGGTFLDIGKLTSLTFTGDDGNDEISIVDVSSLKTLNLTGGGGDDGFRLVNVTVKGNVTIDTGSGADHVLFDGTHTAITGNVGVTSLEAATVTVDAERTLIGGALSAVGGSALLRIEAYEGGPLTIGKGFEVTAGAGTAHINFQTLSPIKIGRLSSGESLLINTPSHVTAIFVADSVTFAGGIRAAGAGSLNLSFNADHANIKIGKSGTGHSIAIDGQSSEVEIRAANLALAGGIAIDAAVNDGLRISVPGGKLSVGKLSSGASIQVETTSNGNLLVNAGSVTMAGGIDYASTGGSSRVEIEATHGAVRIGKLANQASVRFVGAGGNDQLVFNTGNLSLLGGVDFTGGDGNNLVLFDTENGRVNVGKSTGGSSIRYLGGSGTDELSVNAARFASGGGIDFEGGNGFNSVGLSSSGTFTAGRLPSGNSIQYTGGSASDGIYVNTAVGNFLGGFEFNGGDGIGNVDFDRSGVVKIGANSNGRSILFAGGANRDDIFLFGKTALAGVIEFDGGGGNDTLFAFGPATAFGKDRQGDSILFTGGNGNDLIQFSDTVLVPGAIRFAGGLGNDRMEFDDMNSLVLRGPVEFEGGEGDDRVDIYAYSMQLSKGLTILGGGGVDQVDIYAHGKIAGDLIIELGVHDSGNRQVNIQSRDGRLKGLTITGNLTVQSSGNGSDTLNLVNLVVGKDFTATMGSGESIATLDNLAIGGTLNLNTGAGSDFVEFEVQSLFGPSVVSKLATIVLGDGADTLRIGNAATSASAPFPDPSRARFLGGFTVDPGAGSDVRGDIAGQNDFPGGPPTGLDAFEGVF